MQRNIVLFLVTSILLWGCINDTNTNKVVVNHNTNKTSLVKSTQVDVSLTDSTKIVKHLDSLAKPTFNSDILNEIGRKGRIDLREFRNEKLFHLHYRRIPREIGDANIEMTDDDSSFDLCDSTYKVNWLLVVRKKNFFAVEAGALLMTFDYRMKLIDAILIEAQDPSNNNHFKGNLNTYIHKNLELELHYSYLQADDEGHFDEGNEKYGVFEDDIWLIDKNGRFKPIKYTAPD